MESQFLTVRLGADDAALLSELNRRTGQSKSEIVKRALRSLANESEQGAATGLFTLGANKFGKHGDSSRQSADAKAIVRARLHAKHSR